MEKREEALKKQFNLAQRSSRALTRVLQKLTQTKNTLDAEEIEIYHDSIVKRFELTYETFWKYLKAYIASKHGLDVTAPRDVFRTCLRLKVTSREETDTLLEMIDARNLTTHLYDQETAHKTIMKTIPTYVSLIMTILQRTKMEISDQA